MLLVAWVRIRNDELPSCFLFFCWSSWTNWKHWWLLLSCAQPTTMLTMIKLNCTLSFHKPMTFPLIKLISIGYYNVLRPGVCRRCGWGLHWRSWWRCWEPQQSCSWPQLSKRSLDIESLLMYLQMRHSSLWSSRW